MNLEAVKNRTLSILHIYSRMKTYNRYKKTTNIKKLTKEQKKEIEDYYKKEFGICVPTKYHELLYSMCGVFKKEYMPFDVYEKLLEALSPYKYKKILDDKILYDWILSNVKMPERVLSCCNGVAYRYFGGGRKTRNF